MTTCLIKLLPVPRSGVERSAAFTTLASNGRARLAMPTLPSCLSKCRLDMTVLNGRPMILEVIWLLGGFNVASQSPIGSTALADAGDRVAVDGGVPTDREAPAKGNAAERSTLR